MAKIAKELMGAASFEAVCSLISMRNSKSRESARLVLVFGRKAPEVAAELDMGVQGVHDAILRIRKGVSLCMQVAEQPGIAWRPKAKPEDSQSQD